MPTIPFTITTPPKHDDKLILKDPWVGLAAIILGLEALSPLKVLVRGYSVVQDDKDQVLHRKADFYAGQKISLRISDGYIDAKVCE